MRIRIMGAATVALLLCALIAFGAPAASSATTSGTLTGWTGNAMFGANYALLTLDALATNPQMTIQWSGSGHQGEAYCGVTSGAHYPPTAQDQYAWIARWGWDHTHVTGTTTVTLSCTTQYILVAVLSAPAPTISVAGGVTSTPSVTATATFAPTSTATSSPIPSTATSTPSATSTLTVSPPPTLTNTPFPPTNTPSPLTATPSLTPTATAGDGGSTCTGAAGEVDQNGISVYVWAPGKRTSCAGAGYENGDNPMPAGTHLPAPRPFNFDAAVVMHESPFGFKVYYRQGSEAPDPYKGVGGCGDVRVILHMGGSTKGMVTQFHTYQFASDVCDSAGNHHIIDVAGRIDTGTLFLRSQPDSQRPDGPNRTTADTSSCNGTTTFICATVWYAFFNFALPGGAWTGFSHMGFLIENPITLYDDANPSAVHLTGNDGTTTMFRDNQWGVPDHSASDWWCLFNTVSQINEVVSPGTAGAWQMHVDVWFSGTTLEPSYGLDHQHPIPNIVYPN